MTSTTDQSSDETASPKPSWRKRFAGGVGGAILAVALVVGLLGFGAFDAEAFFRHVTALPLWAIVGFVLLTWLNLLLTAYKWTLVNRLLLNHAPSWRWATFWVTTGAIGGQFLPSQASFTGVRVAALRLHSYASTGAALRTVVIDQGLDFLIAFALALPAAVFLFAPLASETGNTVLSLILLVMVIAAIPVAVPLASRWTVDGENTSSLRKRVHQLFHGGHQLPPKALTRLALWSLVRFGLLMSRAALLAYALHSTGLAILSAVAFPFVHLSALASVTPANLGVQEWTWTGLLALGAASHGLVVATAILITYALLFRLLTLLGQALGIALLVLLGWRKG